MIAPALFNLDREADCADFLRGYGHLRGARLASALGLTGKGSQRGAEALLSYARVRTWGFKKRLAGDIRAALDFERQADAIYMRIPETLRW